MLDHSQPFSIENMQILSPWMSLENSIRTTFWDLREFDAFCGSLTLFCGSFAGNSRRFFSTLSEPSLNVPNQNLKAPFARSSVFQLQSKRVWIIHLRIRGVQHFPNSHSESHPVRLESNWRMRESSRNQFEFQSICFCFLQTRTNKHVQTSRTLELWIKWRHRFLPFAGDLHLFVLVEVKKHRSQVGIRPRVPQWIRLEQFEVWFIIIEISFLAKTWFCNLSKLLICHKFHQSLSQSFGISPW